MNRPLSEKRIVVTRAIEQSHALSRQLTALGAVVIEIPAIRIAELNQDPLKNAIRRIERYSLVIFTSASAVHIFCRALEQLPGRADAFAALPIAVIGSATARALEERGFQVSIVPDEFVAEGLVAAIRRSGIPLNGRTILIPRAKTARAVLTRELKEMGAEVDDIPVYETLPEPFARNASLLHQLTPAPDVLTFTSSSTVTFFRDGLPAGLLSDLQVHSIAACIGPIAADTARSAGFTVEIIPDTYSIDGLVSAIVDYYRAGE